eukprot:Clim_evm16s166 gene=Clim_evmTU16s166
MSFGDLDATRRATGGMNRGPSGLGPGGPPGGPQPPNDGGGGGPPARQPFRDYPEEDEKFRALSIQIEKNIFTIGGFVTDLQRMLNGLGTARDTPEFRERMHEVQSRIGALAKETAPKLQELSQLQSSPEDARFRRMQQQKLLRDFEGALQRFQSVEKEIAVKERETVAQVRQQSLAMETSPLEQDSEQQRLILQQQQQQRQELENDTTYNEQIIAEREQGIRHIEQTITEVNEIFRDLATIVHEQGTTLDNIEANIVSTSEQVGDGRIQLNKADDYQRKARNKMCCIAAVLAIVCAIILIIVLSKR